MIVMRHDELTAEQARDLRALAGAIIPPSRDYGVPGADDELIFTAILGSLERDHDDVACALAQLAALAGGAFADLGPERRTEGAASYLVRSAARRSRHWSAWCCFATTATTG
jgi:hypothetical protein